MKEYNFKINGNDYNVAVKIQSDNEAEVLVNGASYTVEVVDATVKKAVAVKPQVAAVPASHPVQPSTVQVSKPAPAAAGNAGESPVKSPLPGVILDIKVNVGDTVKKGQTIIILEAMKMENEILAPRDGTVAQVVTSKGAVVETGAPLVVLA